MENVIYSYTKQDAIEDGSQIDVSKIASECGFKIPVYITSGINGLCTPSKKSNNDYMGRLWDILSLASIRVRVESKKVNPEYLNEFKVRIGRKNYKLWIIFNEVEGFTIMIPSEY